MQFALQDTVAARRLHGDSWGAGVALLAVSPAAEYIAVVADEPAMRVSVFKRNASTAAADGDNDDDAKFELLAGPFATGCGALTGIAVAADGALFTVGRRHAAHWVHQLHQQQQQQQQQQRQQQQQQTMAVRVRCACSSACALCVFERVCVRERRRPHRH